MKRVVEICTTLFFAAVLHAAPVFGDFGDTAGGVVIGRAELLVRPAVEEEGMPSPRLEGIEVEVVREESPGSDVPEEKVQARTTSAGIFMSPVESLEGSFRISRVKLPDAEDWIEVSRLSVRGDVSRYGAAAFHTYGSVAALNTIICEKDPDGQYKFIMRVEPFSGTCQAFMDAFPLSPWNDVVEEAKGLSMKGEVKVAETVETEAAPAPAKEKTADDAAGEKKASNIKISMRDEGEAKGSKGILGIVIIVSLVLVVLAVVIGAGGRKRYQPKEREIDIGEIEMIEAEREKQGQSAEDEEEQKEQPDPTAILLDKEGWFLREFRRARVRIHWKKYDSAAVSLEKTTRFMEEHIDRLNDKKEVYTLVLHCSYLGRCYLESGRINDALRVFKRGIELNEYNSRMCEMGLADTLDSIARSEESPTAEGLSAKYPLLNGREIEAIMMMSKQPEQKA